MQRKARAPESRRLKSCSSRPSEQTGVRASFSYIDAPTFDIPPAFLRGPGGNRPALGRIGSPNTRTGQGSRPAAATAPVPKETAAQATEECPLPGFLGEAALGRFSLSHRAFCRTSGGATQPGAGRRQGAEGSAERAAARPIRSSS